MVEALDKLFELEPERELEPCAHGRPALAAGWWDLVSEVERCAVCFEVVAIRLAPDPRARPAEPFLAARRRR